MTRWMTTLLCCLGMAVGCALAASQDGGPSSDHHICYKGPVEVELVINDAHALEVTIHTQRLLLRSLQPGDLDSVIALMGDPVVMEKFASGVTKTPAESTQRFTTWYNRWETMDPYSALAINLNDDNNTFIGLVILGHGDDPGQSELAYLLHEQYWNQGYGKETITAVVRDYAYLLMLKGYGPEGIPLKQIVATARTDNTASWKILESVGMEYCGTSQKFGQDRRHYAIDASKLRHDL